MSSLLNPIVWTWYIADMFTYWNDVFGVSHLFWWFWCRFISLFFTIYNHPFKVCMMCCLMNIEIQINRSSDNFICLPKIWNIVIKHNCGVWYDHYVSTNFLHATMLRYAKGQCSLGRDEMQPVEKKKRGGGFHFMWLYRPLIWCQSMISGG